MPKKSVHDNPPATTATACYPNYDSIALWINEMIAFEFDKMRNNIEGTGLEPCHFKTYEHRLGVLEGRIKGRLMEYLIEKLGGRSW